MRTGCIDFSLDCYDLWMRRSISAAAKLLRTQLEYGSPYCSPETLKRQTPITLLSTWLPRLACLPVLVYRMNNVASNLGLVSLSLVNQCRESLRETTFLTPIAPRRLLLSCSVGFAASQSRFQTPGWGGFHGAQRRIRTIC